MEDIDMRQLAVPLAMLNSAIEERGLDPLKYDIYTDQDMIVYALHYLLANVDQAFEKLEI